MAMILFAMIGALLKAGTAYWIAYALYCVLKVTEFILDLFKEFGDDDKEGKT